MSGVDEDCEGLAVWKGLERRSFCFVFSRELR